MVLIMQLLERHIHETHYGKLLTYNIRMSEQR